MIPSFSEPKKITLHIEKVVDLGITDERQRKLKVQINGGKRKVSTEVASYSFGIALWNSLHEIKLSHDQLEPLTLLIHDSSSATTVTHTQQFGQVCISMSHLTALVFQNIELIKNKNQFFDENKPLEPSKKCQNPIGQLYYRIRFEEFYVTESPMQNNDKMKRQSIFGLISTSRRQSYIVPSHRTQSEIKQASELRPPVVTNQKRFSLFKQQDNHKLQSEERRRKYKAKSLANINSIEDMDYYDENGEPKSDSQATSSVEGDISMDHIPHQSIVDNVCQDLGWLRVSDLYQASTEEREDDTEKLNQSTDNEETEKWHSEDVNKLSVNVRIWSVQPDHGPTSGNFSVILEGYNFSRYLYDLVYVWLHHQEDETNSEHFDATECTEIMSDTELLLKMPAVDKPGLVFLNFELMDGTQLSCSKAFHYTETDDVNQPVLTPRPFDSSAVCPSNNHNKTNLQNFHTNSSSSSSSPTLFRFNGMLSDFEEANRADNSYLSQSANIPVKGNPRISINLETHTPSNEENLCGISNSRTYLEDKERRRSSTSMNYADGNKSRDQLEDQIIELKFRLAELENKCIEIEYQKDREIEMISKKLCKLEIRLLEDGLTKYLELDE